VSGHARACARNRFDEHLAVSHATHVVPVRVQRGDREVVVGVDQAGHEHRAGEVDDLGVGCVRTMQQLGVTDGDDPFPVDEHDLGARRGAIHRQHCPAGERAHGGRDYARRVVRSTRCERRTDLAALS